MKNKNMYQLAVQTWSPFKGCKFDCLYCKTSFQAQAKRQKHNCIDCYDYKPHTHPDRLTNRLKPTGFMQFIFVCASGDIAFCPYSFREKIIERMRQEPNKTFLVQSKDPNSFKDLDWPDNVILGTTIETDKNHLYEECAITAGAPLPCVRVMRLQRIKHPYKMVTIEPVINFNMKRMLRYIEDINPCMVWLGYNSKSKPKLPEPPIEKVKELHWELSRRGIVTILKTIPERVLNAT